MVRRSAWLDGRTELLVRILAEKHGMQVVDEHADEYLAALRADISDHLDLVAERMRIGRQAAKMYVTDEVIDDMANRLATQLRREQVRPRHLRSFD